ncbi:MAG TPA: 5'/3'-nucleotidase SurE [Bacteriovoracaceae bacterium]|nr:5'/3'-nucleotidase SurE [Bacteriovoracaceae bacterium]
MKILLSNDDGVNAAGIRSLYREISPLYNTTIIAPLEERSTTGHSLSLDKPLRLERLENNIYGCSGFPADCVLMGIGHMMKAEKPDVVVSGINRGANLGQDLYYSGTIAAAREAAFHKVPSFAVSLVFENMQDPHRYETAAAFIRMCLEHNLHKACPHMTVLNINVPNRELKDIKGCKLTEIGFRQYSEEIHARMDARDREYFWIAGIYKGYAPNPASDCHAIHEGYISVTPHALVDGCDKVYTGLNEIIRKLNAEFSP